MRFGKRSIPEAPAQPNADVKYLVNSKFENMNLGKYIKIKLKHI